MAERESSLESRLLRGSQALVAVNRLSIDRQFNQEFGDALQTGDAARIGELLGQMGIDEVELVQTKGQTGVSFRLGLTVCIQVTITVCKEF
jgi:hypothetical protein